MRNSFFDKLKMKSKIFPIILLLLVLLPVRETKAETFFSKEYNFEKDYVLKGTYDNAWMYISIPEYVKIKSLNVEAHLGISPLLVDIPATLTFYFDDVPVYSIELSYINGDNQTISFPIEIKDIAPGYHSLQITGTARIFDEEGCIDDKTDANWTVIKQESNIRMDYELNQSEGLSDYPYPFINISEEAGDNLAIVVPNNANDAELTAASYIRADLSTMVSDDNILLTRESDCPSNRRNRIYVGLKDSFDNNVKNLIDKSKAGNLLKNDNGYIFEEDNNDGNAQLVVTALNEDILINLSRCMTAKKLLSQYEKYEAWPGLANLKAGKAGVKELYSVRELTNGMADLRFDGAFRQEKTLYIPTKGYILGDGGEIDLRFRYCKNLDFGKSVLTVYFDGTPVASHKLTEQNADYDTLTCSVPEDMIGKKISSIVLAFQLELPETYCSYQITSLPWASISGDSSFRLPMGNSRILSFDAYPYPFVKGGLFDNTYFVVPNEPTESDLSLLGQLISLYSQGTMADGEMKVIREENLTQEQKKDGNLIYVGTLNEFDSIAEYKDIVPFSFSTSDSRFLGNIEMPLSTTNATSSSALQIIPSPYSKDKAILLALSASPAAEEKLSNYLKSAKNRNELNKDTVFLDKESLAYYFDFQTISSNVETPSFRERITANKESVEFVLISTSAMILLLLCTILIIYKTKEQKKKTGKYKAKH